ncbi:MAG: MATE family efflux transporter [Eubacteriales bacterium]|nr:MATE family efflux transporter [Eubacteriales bacterium]
MANDLTTGKPDRVLWRYCLPLFGSIVFQQLYNIADSVVAGKFIGAQALAAVGNSYEVTLIYLAFAFGLNVGTSVVTARYFGAKQITELKTAVYTSFLFSTAVCVVLQGAGFLFSPMLLRLIQTPEEIMGDSLLYLNIYTAGLLFLFLYNIATGVFASFGDSKTPFLFLAVSSASNILLDILFVAGFQMGVAGVAWATFLCQSLSSVAAIIVLFRHLNAMKSPAKPTAFSWHILGNIVKIALPSTLQQSFVSVGNIAIQSIINGFGTSAIAGYSAAIKFNNFAITSFSTLGNGMSNFTAQNLGAGSPERVRLGFHACCKMMAVIMGTFIAVYLLLGSEILQLFLDENSMEACKIGVSLLTIIAPFYVTVAAKLAADGVLRGSGLMGEFMVGTFADLFLRVGFAFLLSRPLGITGVWWSWPIGWVVGAALSLFFYRKGKWSRMLSN